MNALFRQTGVIRADTLDEMFDLAAALDRQPLPAGRRVAILSDGSGPGILCAGACEAARLTVPPLSEPTAERLAAFLPSGTPIGNPLELVFSPTAEPYRQALETLLRAPEVDALIAIHTPLDESGSEAMVEAIRQGVAAARASGGDGKPVLACLLAKEDAGAPMVLGDVEHSDVRVPGVGRAGSREGGRLRGVARRLRTGSFPTSTTSTRRPPVGSAGRRSRSAEPDLSPRTRRGRSFRPCTFPSLREESPGRPTRPWRSPGASGFPSPSSSLLPGSSTRPRREPFT